MCSGVVAVLLLLTACTSSTTSTPTEPTATESSVATTPSPAPGTTLADGSTLPTGCKGNAVPSETAAFVADGRAWALDPSSGRLSCLFEVADPGAFAFGPQGDRVLLADMQVEGVSALAPTWPAKGPTPSVFDWGHPIGLAIVYATTADQPLKRFIVDEGERQGIWISTNEGTDPQRLVFSRPDTVFSSLAFSPDGQTLWWIAQHAGAISEIHWMDLADRSGFSQVLSRGLAPTAHGLVLAPTGTLMAATQGEGCADSQG